MELDRKNFLWDRCLIVLTICCIMAYLIVFAVTNIFGFTLFCDSDMYADTTVARLIWEQKSLFPKGWVFSNQYYVFATPVFAALFYGLTGNTNTAMILATELMTLIVLASYFWVMRALAADRLSALIGCLLLLSSTLAPTGPRSSNAQLFYLQASYYSCYLITLLVVLGDYIRSAQSGRLRPAAWILSLLLCFTMGMQSLRQTVVMVLPILCCEILFTLRRVLKRETIWDSRNRYRPLRAVSYAAANFAGIALIEWYNVPHNSLYGSVQWTPFAELPQRSAYLWTALSRISGLQFVYGENFSPFYALFGLFMVCTVITTLVLWLAHIKADETPLTLCWLVCLVGVFGVALSTILTYVQARSIYLFVWFPLVAFSSLLIIRNVSIPTKRILVVIICILSLGNLFHSYGQGANAALQNRPFNADFVCADEEMADSRQLCQWAMEEGYTYVYGDWFTAPRIAVHSGGALSAGYWYKSENTYHILSYLNRQDIYGPMENSEAIYVFTPADEALGLQLAQEQGVALTKVAQFGMYRAYTSPVPLMHTQAYN